MDNSQAVRKQNQGETIYMQYCFRPFKIEEGKAKNETGYLCITLKQARENSCAFLDLNKEINYIEINKINKKGKEKLQETIYRYE